MSKLTRKDKEKLVLDTMNILDKTGLNTKRYEEIFASMDDRKFNQFLKDLKEDREYIRMEIQPYENEPSLAEIEEAAKFLNCPLEEYVYYNHEKTSSGKAVRSLKKVPVGLLLAQVKSF